MAPVLSMVLVVAAITAPPASVSYEQFNVNDSVPKLASGVDLTSHPRARTYRTLLRTAAQEPPDFAGHYKIVRIGCGTSCVTIAVIDRATKKVFFPKILGVIQWANWYCKDYGPDYRLDSRLLVIRGTYGTEEAAPGLAYFEWRNGDFRLLKFDPANCPEPAATDPEG
jgi:hypothetical protein